MVFGKILPFWVTGVVVSFALPTAEAWLILVMVLLLFAMVWQFPKLLLPLFFVSGIAYGVWRTQNSLSAQWPLEAQQVRLSVTVTDLPQKDENRVRLRVEAIDEKGRSYRLQLSDYQLRDWPVGSRWLINARVRPPIGEVNTLGFNREAWALANRINGIGTVGKWRESLGQSASIPIQKLRETISLNWQGDSHSMVFSDGRALMRALGIGEQGALSIRLWQVFRPLGLNHLVSISGLHVGMVAFWAGWLLKKLLYILPYTPARPKAWILAAGVSTGLAYAALAGFSIPTQRSILMLFAFAWAWWRGSGCSVWQGWWQALAMVLLIEPSAVLDNGFWLSFGLVAALLWISFGRNRKYISGWRLAVDGQLAVTVLSVIVLGVLFSSVPIISPLVNAVAIPWFSWILVPLALLASLLPWPPLQWLAAAAGEYTLQVLAKLAEYAPEYTIAAAPWPLAVLAVIAAGLVLLPRGLGLKPFALIVLLGFLVYKPPMLEKEHLKATVWDVGQGLSVLLQTRNHSLLFDTGTEAAANMAVVPSLNAAGVKRLDGLVLSHHDVDHDGGFTILAKAKQPDVVWAGQPEFYPNARHCEEQAWQWDGVRFEFLRAAAMSGKEHDNDQSCILRVLVGHQALLLTGDLSQAGEQALVNHYGKSLYSQVLLLGHHGSNSSSSGTFLNVVSPVYAVASSGYANPYQHPSKAVRNRVRAHDARLLRTDLSGGLWFELDNEGIRQGRLKTWKPYWQKKPFE
ncbi:DNA internalization-related competence protein ComEC/Rec2 [Neisseria sp. S1]|uniref:DNA internalization-related competence protein ComEC/Rec2 n=1 Tax=Neisseria sp. S1 TaxID=3318354 RepID=UPI003A8B856A